MSSTILSLSVPLIVLLVAIVVNIFFGLVIIISTYKKIYGWFFLLTILGIIFWSIGDILVLFSKTNRLVYIGAEIFYITPMIIPMFIWFFSLSFPNNIFPKIKYLLLASTYFILLSSLFLFDFHFIVKGIKITNFLNVSTPNSLGFSVYGSYLSVFFTATYITLWIKSRIPNLLRNRQQILYMFYGSIVASLPALFTNLVLPIFGIKTLIWLGPIFTLFFTFSVTISIIKHKLFDIRLVIVRSLAYLGSLTALSALYGFVIFNFAKFVLRLNFNIKAEIFLSIATGLASLSFARIKKAFDRITNKVFYRDAYDPQEFYDNLNKVLISTLEISKLSKQTTALIERVLKTQFCVIGLKSKEGLGYRIFGTEHPNFKAEDVDKVRNLTPHIHRNVIAADDLEDNQTELKSLLDDNDISVLIKLTNNIKKSSEGLGYLILGPKKSGNQYNSLDIKVLDTLSKELVIAIQNSLHYEEIEQFNITLQDKVNQATSKLRKTNEKLRALDESKDDFISMASHQLRTPLTSVKGYISMVLDGDAGKVAPLQRNMLNQAFFSSQRMVYLIADLLNVSRLKTGKFAIEPKEVNLANLIDEEMAQLIETAKSKKIILTYQKPTNFPELYLDETKIRQVVMNFIDNAIYYTQSGGKVDIILEEKPQTIEFRVVDNGIGVPKAEAHHLFTKFYRASNARKARPDGTGLGLFMAKKVIIAEGGSVLFDSKEGEGSTFGFMFAKEKLKITKENIKVKPV